jgi:hypothetical protein
MNRIEFTDKISELLQQMVSEGESPIIDFAKRSTEEQARLFKAGLSKCDGVKIVSKHQVGRAMDILFIRDGQIGEPVEGYQYWHDKWVEMGGAKMIEWDRNHFEG